MITRRHCAVTALLAAGVLAQGQWAAAQEFVPAVVFDMGGKFDKSFNEAAYNGAEKFKKDSGIAYRDFEVTNEAQREQALRNTARQAKIGAALSNSFAFGGLNAVLALRAV